MESVIIEGTVYGKDDLWKIAALPEADEAFVSFLKEWFSDSECVVAHTSGSTGEPKFISLQKNVMRESAKRTNAFFSLKNGDTILMCLSAAYIAGKMMVVRAIVGGLNLFLQCPSSLPKIERHYNIASMVPMQISSMIEKGEAETINRLDYLLVGGASLRVDCVEYLSRLSVRTYLSFGMTETVSHVALARLTTGAEMVYNALPDVTFDQDERSCLVINAPCINVEGMVTNDIVSLHSPTSFSWIGRYDNVINSGGIKVFPEQIERKISRLMPCEFYVSSKPDSLLGRRVVLVVESDRCDGLIEKLRPVLSRYELPREVICMDKFERTKSGKIKRI